jgi:acetyltransferase-like isoleucine patch superfamily enzyme
MARMAGDAKPGALGPRPPSALGQVRAFARTYGVRRLATIWAEEWLGWLVRSVPGLTGFGLRWLLCKLLFERLDGFCFLYPGAHLHHSYGIRAGRNLHLNSNVYVDARGGLTIGSNVLVGPNVVIVTSQHHWTDPDVPIVLQGHVAEAVTIGDDVWIGADVVVNPGVTIASGTVVGAGAVVTSDTEPYTIVGGVPARRIGERPRPSR